jgi:SsrA-binding protein
MAKGKKQRAADGPPVISNPRARYRFELIERLECGISLVGPEVKSLRAGLASIDEGYARIKGNQLWLLGVHIAEYTDKGYATHEVLRPRKLLIHKREILRLRKAIERKGLTLVPTRIYFSDRNMAKVEVALARGKNVADKRQSDKERTANREIRGYRR